MILLFGIRDDGLNWFLCVAPLPVCSHSDNTPDTMDWRGICVRLCLCVWICGSHCKYAKCKKRTKKQVAAKDNFDSVQPQCVNKGINFLCTLWHTLLESYFFLYFSVWNIRPFDSSFFAKSIHVSRFFDVFFFNRLRFFC